MKKIIAFALALIMIIPLAACSNGKKNIEGTITGYVRVEEYTGPLAIIEVNGKNFYLATSILVAATEAGQSDDSLLETIKNGGITDIKVIVNEAEKGKSLKIDGNKVTVWQSHQIQKAE